MFDEIYVDCPQCQSVNAASEQFKPGSGESYPLEQAPPEFQVQMIGCHVKCRKCGVALKVEGKYTVDVRVVVA